jgi:hypothetical protein
VKASLSTAIFIALELVTILLLVRPKLAVNENKAAQAVRKRSTLFIRAGDVGGDDCAVWPMRKRFLK